MMFRWFALAVFLASLSISAWRARRTKEAIPRARILVVCPLFGGVLAYLANPHWMAWASLNVPSWIQWIGVALGVVMVPSVYWVMATFGGNVGETGLTKPQHRLVTIGPYRWVRHPMYTMGIALSVSIGLMAANGFILLWAVVVLIAVRLVVIPREEATLVEVFGDEYRRYRSGTGSFLPFVPRRRQRVG
ncbi:MAG: isoprenylcysteine carboxylmethyltransferase family protein [Acidobacteria bacterium]|nr:isoprenylcysteine carboxylmethyltransferase family protein [Acidobacteriota bacterium]